MKKLVIVVGVIIASLVALNAGAQAWISSFEPVTAEPATAVEPEAPAPAPETVNLPDALSPTNPAPTAYVPDVSNWPRTPYTAPNIDIKLKPITIPPAYVPNPPSVTWPGNPSQCQIVINC